jgi:hypothetical protein
LEGQQRLEVERDQPVSPRDLEEGGREVELRPRSARLPSARGSDA